MIGIFIILVVCFIVMTSFPFILALRTPKDEQATLVVRSDNVKDPRYFPKAFKEILNKALEKGVFDEFLILSRPEKFVYSEKVNDNVIHDLVICRDGFIAVGPARFEKEIYSENTVVLDEQIEARAVSAQKLLLMNKCKIVRWCDGEKETYVGTGCDLGVSTTSDDYMQVMEDCVFHRLYAPQVDVMRCGDSKQIKREKRIVDSSILQELKNADETSCDVAAKDISIIYENSNIKGNIITKDNLVIKEGARISGHIKSRKNITIEKNVIIDGNVFADGNVIIKSDVRVTGNVFSQSDVYVGYNSIIGQYGKIKSVIAKSHVFLCENITVFGYIGCDDKGYTLQKEKFLELLV